MVGAGQKLEDSVGPEVASSVTNVLAEGEASLYRTDSEAGLSGSDIVLGGPTQGEDWDKQ